MKIGVWYHCLIRGPRIPSEDNAIAILWEQMRALQDSGLAAAADEIHVGVNGSDSDALTVSALVPDQTILHINHDGQSELATMKQLRSWLTPDWAVLYHHIKGVQYDPTNANHQWRRSMERVCVAHWRQCVAKLEQGYETAGRKWITPLRGQRYWAGNFWWATSEYLLTLPDFAPDTHDRRYEAEVWIGTGGHAPTRFDFEPNANLYGL